MIGSRHILGLAIDEAGVVAAEVVLQAGRPTVRQTAELRWKQELTPKTATELGEQLREFLRERSFSARKAVVGLAAKWVLAREITVPPAGADALAGMLAIQAEHAFSIGADELLFDYCGKTGTSQESQMLLLAARRRTVRLIEELGSAADLRIASVTISSLACGLALSEAGSTYRYGLYARPDYCELWGQLNGIPRFIKHVPVATAGKPVDYLDVLTSTIRRHVVLSARADQRPPHEVTAYDAGGLADGGLDRLGEQLGPRIRIRDGRAASFCDRLGLADRPEGMAPLAAAAVASTALEGQGPPVDFLNPRIGARKTTSHKRLVGWAAFVGAACAIALASVLADWHGDRRDIAAYTQQLAQMSEDIVAAQTVVDRVSYASSWASRDPRFLECLRELTLAFPEEGSVWATSLALNEGGTGTLVGKARNEPSFYAVLDEIKQSPAFSSVQMVHIRNAGRDSSDKEFAINFTFQGMK